METARLGAWKQPEWCYTQTARVVVWKQPAMAWKQCMVAWEQPEWWRGNSAWWHGNSQWWRGKSAWWHGNSRSGGVETARVVARKQSAWWHGNSQSGVAWTQAERWRGNRVHGSMHAWKNSQCCMVPELRQASEVIDAMRVPRGCMVARQGEICRLTTNTSPTPPQSFAAVPGP